MNLLAVYTLWQRELVRFIRQPSRLFSAIATPLLFWLLIGAGFSQSFRLPGVDRGPDFLEYFYPGTLVLLIMFAAIFSTISVIEDRNEGFLQGVLVAPVGRMSLVTGKILGGATLAWLQAIPMLLLAPVAGIRLEAGSALLAAGVLALLAATLTAIGFAFAWKVDSTQGFHAVMNLVLMPMWLLSGAFFPMAGAPTWLAAVMRINPLTYGVAALRRALYPGAIAPGESLPGFAESLAILAACWLLAVIGDLWVTRRGGTR